MHQQHSNVMRTSSIKLLHNQLQTAEKELNVRSSEIVKLRASVQDLSDKIKLAPVKNQHKNYSQIPQIPQAPPSHNFKLQNSSTATSDIGSNSTSTACPMDYYRDQVRMLQERLLLERKQHYKDRKRWDSEKHNVLDYQNKLQDQYTNLVDAFAHQSVSGSVLSVVDKTNHY
jgi:hypothetical protein